jgi:hypothetical protein
MTALIEVIGPGVSDGPISANFISELMLWSLNVPATLRLADLTAKSAAKYGITIEISIMIP